MNKNEFLAFSLPYELVITDEELQEFPILTGIEYTSEQCLAIQGDSGESDIDSVMPVLHPLSDLTKEIEHGGEKFIPIVELAKSVKSKLLPANPAYTIDECYAPNCVRYSDHYIWFNGDSVLHSILTEAKEHKLIVHNQIELLLKLIEWHFDIAGLIEKGEAIDVNTLEENPYK